MNHTAGVNNPEVKANAGRPEIWELRIYIAGKTPRSLAALSNLKRICEDHLKTRYRLQVIDLLEAPQLASADQIVAIPTVLRSLPLPQKKIAGDLSNTEGVLLGLEVPTSGVERKMSCGRFRRGRSMRSSRTRRTRIRSLPCRERKSLTDF